MLTSKNKDMNNAKSSTVNNETKELNLEISSTATLITSKDIVNEITEKITDNNASKEVKTTKTTTLSTTSSNNKKITTTKISMPTTSSIKVTAHTIVSSTQNETTTKITTTKRTKVKTETIEESEIVETKYGVDKTKITTYKIITYSDDTTEKNKSSETYKYNYAGFNATTTDLLAEATTISQNNMPSYNEVVAKVNEYRSAAESEPITLDEQLCLAATIRAMELAYANKFEHIRPNGKSFSTILEDFKISYSAAGENIAAGHTTVSGVMQSWYNSSQHRANMESKYFKKIGVGKYKLPNSKYGTYWVQLFTN